MHFAAIRFPLAVFTFAAVTLLATNSVHASAGTATVGQTVTFSVTADGTTPFSYQWSKNGANITGATGATYSISSVQLTDAGTYCVAVSNSAGSITSDNATFTVNPAAVAPVFTTQPVSQTVTAGASVTFTAAASGSPAPTYQWRKNGTNISGATSATYTIARVTSSSAGTYSVVATNSVGSATSNGAVLRIISAKSIVPVDFNIDGCSDILWQNIAAGECSIWLMNGTTQSSVVSLGVVSTDWSIAGIGDFNDDGNPDILWQNTATGERSIWLMNGTTQSSVVSLGVVSTNWSIAGIGDFNGDGNPDILWQNTATGERSVWLMKGTTQTSVVSLGVVSTDWSIAGTGDFNGDGPADILWQNTVTGQMSVWLMNGTTQTSVVSLGFVNPEWSIAGTGDFDGDRNPDILWQNTVTGERSVWLMKGTIRASVVSLGTVSTDRRIRN